MTHADFCDINNHLLSFSTLLNICLSTYLHLETRVDDVLA